MRRELGIPASAIVILTAGQIGLRKGLDTVAAAAVEVSREWSRQVEPDHPEVHWLLAGERFSNKQESIDFEAAIDGQFRSAEPGIRFHSLGFRHDLRDVMNASDILVHGARQEPLGRVLLEAAAAGLAIVATRVGGTEEILESDKSAVLIAAGSGQCFRATGSTAGGGAVRQRRVAGVRRERQPATSRTESRPVDQSR